MRLTRSPRLPGSSFARHMRASMVRISFRLCRRTFTGLTITSILKHPTYWPRSCARRTKRRSEMKKADRVGNWKTAPRISARGRSRLCVSVVAGEIPLTGNHQRRLRRRHPHWRAGRVGVRCGRLQWRTGLGHHETGRHAAKASRREQNSRSRLGAKHPAAKRNHANLRMVSRESHDSIGTRHELHLRPGSDGPPQDGFAVANLGSRRFEG